MRKPNIVLFFTDDQRFDTLRDDWDDCETQWGEAFWGSEPISRTGCR